MKLSSNALKFIACAIMLVDHVGLVLVNNNSIMRHIGRIAFPIFVYALAEGMRHTSDMKKYAARLGAFALISEIPFDLAFHKTPFYLGGQNVFFTLVAGLLFVLCLNKVILEVKWDRRYQTYLLPLLSGLALLALAEVANFDYGAAGLIMVAIAYFFPPATVASKMKAKDMLLRNLVYTAAFAVAIICFFKYSELYALISIFIIYFYSGEKGKEGPELKWAFYAFYPVHLLLLAALAML